MPAPAYKFVWLIRTTQTNTVGQPIFYNFACDVETLEELTEKLRTGLVPGEVLFTRFMKDDQGEYLQVLSRRPRALGGGGIAHIDPQTKRVVEEVE